MLLLTYIKPVGLLTYQPRTIKIGLPVFLHPRVKRTWPWNRHPRTQPVIVEAIKDWGDGKPTAGIRWADGKYECYYVADLIP